MLDRFEKVSFTFSEISRCWHKLASEELSKYELKNPPATYLTGMNKYADAGKDLTDETRDIFYQALESITSNLTELSKEGIPK